MIDWFLAGGWCMWPLLLLFVTGLAFAIERLVTLSRATVDTGGFVGQLERAWRAGGPDEAAELCARTRGPVATVVHAGLLRLERGADQSEKAMETCGAVEIAFLERGLVWLSTVAHLAPMLGFLGTVSGMIHSFAVIRQIGEVVPSEVAGGISEALITTEAGLVIGIVIQCCHNYLSSRVDRLVADLHAGAAAFADLADRLGSGPGAAANGVRR